MRSLISLAFNEELEGELQTFSLFVEKESSINIFWGFIRASFRFFGEPEGIAKYYYVEFKSLDNFFEENSTLPMADSEPIVDIFKYCININTNLFTSLVDSMILKSFMMLYRISNSSLHNAKRCTVRSTIHRIYQCI